MIEYTNDAAHFVLQRKPTVGGHIFKHIGSVGRR